MTWSRFIVEQKFYVTPDRNLILSLNFHIIKPEKPTKVRGHLISKYAKFSKKLTFLTP